MDNKKDYAMHGRLKGAAPPKQPGLELEVVRITSQENRLFVLLSDLPWGAYFHWAGRSIPCDGDESTCDRCARGVPRKWRGYLHALEQHGTGTREVIVELTHTALVTLDLALAMKRYRGTLVHLRKTKGGSKGRFIIEVLERRVTEETLPNEKDPAITMRKLWELNAKRIAQV